MVDGLRPSAAQSMSELLRSQPLVFSFAVHVCYVAAGDLGLNAAQSMSESLGSQS